MSRPRSAKANGSHVTRTVRIPTSLDDGLRRVAEERHTSVNALVEGTMTKFMDFDRFAEVLDYAIVPRTFLVRALGYLDQKEVEDFGRWSGEGPGADTVQFYFKSRDLRAVVKTFESIGSKYARLFSFSHQSRGKTHIVTLVHNMGRNWSVFYAANLKYVFSEIVGTDIQLDIRENMVVGTLEEPAPKPPERASSRVHELKPIALE